MRKFFAVLIATLLPLIALAQARDCRSRESFVNAQTEIDESLAALGSNQPLSKLETKLTTLGWSKDRQTELLKVVFSSDPMTALQKEKHAYVSALSDAVVSSSGPKPRLSKCEAAKQVTLLARKIVAVDKRQYDYAAREFGLKGTSAK